MGCTGSKATAAAAPADDKKTILADAPAAGAKAEPEKEQSPAAVAEAKKACCCAKEEAPKEEAKAEEKKEEDKPKAEEKKEEVPPKVEEKKEEAQEEKKEEPKAEEPQASTPQAAPAVSTEKPQELPVVEIEGESKAVFAAADTPHLAAAGEAGSPCRSASSVLECTDVQAEFQSAPLFCPCGKERRASFFCCFACLLSLFELGLPLRLIALHPMSCLQDEIWTFESSSPRSTDMICMSKEEEPKAEEPQASTPHAAPAASTEKPQELPVVEIEGENKAVLCGC
eukprot:CAMPEP_0194782824 /NCGR_PEP_ID=MMETSP0323_2-20130528/78895_1 /TAXON_ID=2866 ORGANISM="Crypthecodinium cohnii, Strain Seligo" /NCGR_SAMPLE_ID=MMETSP0323_2 /ASSEMBLY_ACC=CAM_ASM_000346 /LENGTH=283 /DNA_ID=CAMNT_0039721663 /DNA_START=17 /DNA_END=870 /DNA_ORIENTATION=+